MPPKRVTDATLGVSGSAISRGIPESQQKAWLKSSAKWPDLKRADWTPIKVLGAGGHAICGLWKRKGNQIPQYVVVKQVARRQKGYLKAESRLLRRIREASFPTGGTDHIVQIYKEYFRDPGAGSSAGGRKNFDPNPKRNGVVNPRQDVARLYLEYCPRGDLDNRICQFQSQLVDQGTCYLWDEEELWRLLGCLARGALVMDIGSEHPGDPRNNNPVTLGFEPIAHFDIKPENILIGNYESIGRPHYRLHSFKFADFGLAVPIPIAQTFNNIAPKFNTNPAWNDSTGWRGTPGYITPEQMVGHPERQIGRRSNSWGIGMIMHEIMTGDDLLPPSETSDFDSNYPEYEYTFSTFRARSRTLSRMPPLMPTFEALGHDLLFAPYSKHLIELVHSCLAYLPSQRLSAQEVLSYVDAMLPVLDQLRASINDNQPLQLGYDNSLKGLEEQRPSYTPEELAAFVENPPYGPLLKLGNAADQPIKVAYIPPPAANNPMVFPAPRRRRRVR